MSNLMESSNEKHTLISATFGESRSATSRYPDPSASTMLLSSQVDDSNPLMHLATVAINSQSRRDSDEQLAAPHYIGYENNRSGLSQAIILSYVRSRENDVHERESLLNLPHDSFHSPHRTNEWSEHEMQRLYRLVLQIFLQNGTLFRFHQKELAEINAHLPDHFENYQSYLDSDVLAKNGALTKKGLFWIHLSIIHNADLIAVHRTPAALCRRYKAMKRANKLSNNVPFQAQFQLAYPHIESPSNTMMNLADAYYGASPRKGQWTLEEDRMLVASITAFFASAGL